MKKRILIITICAILCLVGIIYLQCGRPVTVHSAVTSSDPEGYDVSLVVTANKLFIPDRREFAKRIVQMAAKNQFDDMYLSYDFPGYPDTITVKVYTNSLTKALGSPAVTVSTPTYFESDS